MLPYPKKCSRCTKEFIHRFNQASQSTDGSKGKFLESFEQDGWNNLTTYHGEMLRRTTLGETQRAWHVLFCFLWILFLYVPIKEHKLYLTRHKLSSPLSKWKCLCFSKYNEHSLYKIQVFLTSTHYVMIISPCQ